MAKEARSARESEVFGDGVEKGHDEDPEVSIEGERSDDVVV